MKKRILTILPTLCFSIFILFCSVACLLTPDRSFSEYENRPLAQSPRFSLKALAAGSFTSDYESYVTDQFFIRDRWVSLKARTELLLGKTDVNGVFIGSDGFLCEKFPSPDPARLSLNTAAVKKFAQNAAVPVSFTLIPGSVYLWNDRLPSNAQNADQGEIIKRVYSELECDFDTASVLAAHSSEEIFYLTDHHWTSLGAYYGYTAAAESMGLEPKALGEAFEVLEDFFGTASSACGIEKVGDSVELYVKPSDALRVRFYEDGEWSDGSLYDYSADERKDKYTVFFGGNHPLTVIDTASEGGVLLMIKDSFANAEIPFLCAHFSSIHVIDLRYYKASIADYIAQNGITQVLISYSVANFSTDTNLPALNR